MYDIIKSSDGSNTVFSKEYNQHYHDIKTGAISESLIKHVIPAIEFHKNRKSIKILDICFGLGYNTFSTIYYILKNNLDINIDIFSPEINIDLIKSLKNFVFPKEFDNIKHIIESISNNLYYKDNKISINIAIKNAREYIKQLNNIDIVYQDAFSYDVNKELWSYEYFKDIYNICNKIPIITTYSISSKVRLSMYKAGFYIYEKSNIKRKYTLAFKTLQNDIKSLKYINMKLKLENNRNLKIICDSHMIV